MFVIFFVNRLVEQLCDVLIFNHDPPRCVGCEVRYLATFLVLIYPSTEKVSILTLRISISLCDFAFLHLGLWRSISLRNVM